MDAAERPLPRAETTPPVMNMNLGLRVVITSSQWNWIPEFGYCWCGALRGYTPKSLPSDSHESIFLGNHGSISLSNLNKKAFREKEGAVVPMEEAACESEHPQAEHK